MQQFPDRVSRSKTTMAERVWRQLATEIVTGGVAGGRRLDEVEQSQRLGVSRTPLRESLRQLAALGLVENRPHRGVVVAADAGPSLFQVLVELEGVCARSVAALPAERRRVVADLRPTPEVLLPWLRQSCGNAVLKGLLNTLWYPLTSTSNGAAAQDSAVQQALSGLRDAVVAGDGALAADYARRYVVAWGNSTHLPAANP